MTRWMVLGMGLMAAAAACQDQMAPSQGESFATEEVVENKAAPVTSRELKMMLDPEAFADPLVAAGDLELEVRALVEAMGRQAEGTLTEVDKERNVTFLDVPGSCALRKAGYSFRERIEGDEREVTLKFRSSDRYLAAAADVSTSDALEGKTKLEEDLKPPYVSIFSHSTKAVIDHGFAVESLADVAELFPGLDDAELEDAPLAPVAGLTVQELKLGEMEIDFGKEEAEMSITLWYAGAELPAVAELSFSYSSKSESYDAKSVRRAKTLFDQLQALDAWVAPESLTKTAFVYAADPSFCESAGLD